MLGGEFRPEAGVPNASERQIARLRGICVAHPFPVEQAVNLKCPLAIYGWYKDAWEKLAAGTPDKKIRCNKDGGFEIRRFEHDSMHGFIEGFVRWNGHEVVFGFYGLPYNDAEDDAGRDLTQGFECLGSEKPETLAEHGEFLDQVWKEAPRIKQLKGEKKPRPNDPCECGSGKKFKRCCGR